MNQRLLCIYMYNSASDFLKDSYDQIKRERPQYSIRAWSRNLKASDASTLARILNKKRGVPKELIPNICEFLKLDPQESAYFEFIAMGEGKFEESTFVMIRSLLQKRLQDSENIR